MRNLFISMLALLFLAACSSDDETKKSPNYIRLTTESATTLSEDSDNAIDVMVTLAYTLEKDAVINFVLNNNEGEILSIDEPSLAFHAGDKVKTLKVRSNKKSALNEARLITLTVKDYTDNNMQVWGEGIAITVNPDSDIPALTEEQKTLLDGYSMDVRRLLGKLSCQVKVTFPIDEVGEEGDNVFSKTENVQFNTESIITLSEKATADQPILKMVDNPMGLTAMVRSVLDKEIAINNQVGTQFPSVAEAVKYDEKNEKFSMLLDSLVLSEEGTVAFVGNVLDSYGDTISGIPFQFSYTAWDRQLKMMNAGATVDIVVKDPSTGEILYTEPESPMSSLVEMGMTFNPHSYLVSSDISEDSWETGIWKEPTSKLDFAEGTLTFTFPWDHMNSSDWTLIEVTYTLHPATK